MHWASNECTSAFRNGNFGYIAEKSEISGVFAQSDEWIKMEKNMLALRCRFRQALALCAAVASVAGPTIPAHGQYIATPLPLPATYSTATVAAGYRNQQVGLHFLWNGASGSIISLASGPLVVSWGPSSSFAYAVTGNNQAGDYLFQAIHHGGSGKGGGGSGYTLIYHAALWHGSGDSLIDLNPAGYGASEAFGVTSAHQVGFATNSTTGAQQAFLWSSTAASGISLNPTGYLQSIAEGVSGGDQVGYGYPPASTTTVALLWKGTAASFVNLHPDLPGFSSAATAVDSATNEQVGYVSGVSPTYVAIQDAYLWHGTAASGVDLNPAGASQSAALAVAGGYQVGYEVLPTYLKHAMLWHGTAASAVDLQSFLPATYNASVATGIDTSDGSIVGYAITPYNSGIRDVPMVWRPTTESIVTANQSPLPDAKGWSIQPVTVTLTSPYSTPTGSITFAIGSGVSTKSPGNTVQIAFKSSGTFVIAYSAADGAGQKTPTHQYTVNLDLTAPTTTLSYSNSTVILTAQDPSGDPVTTYYKLDGSAYASTYNSPFVLSNLQHTIEYWSADSHGNTETHHLQTLAAAAPTLVSLSQNTVLSGSPDLGITVTGTGFNQYSEVLWNGVVLPAVYLNPTSMQVTIPAAEMASPIVAAVTVTNPSPGTGTSGSLPFTVYQKSVVTGIGQNTGGSTFTLSPISSISGFTLAGNSIKIVTTAGTTFVDPSGVSISATTFFDTVEDGDTITATGVYTSGQLTAWNVQIVTSVSSGGGS